MDLLSLIIGVVLGIVAKYIDSVAKNKDNGLDIEVRVSLGMLTGFLVIISAYFLARFIVPDMQIKL